MSEIGAKNLLRALGDILKVRDVKQAPGELDTSSVKVVTALDPGWAGYSQFQLLDLSFPISGTSSFTWEPIGRGALGSNSGIDSTAYRLSQGVETVLLGISISITYDAAGAAAEDGHRISLSINQQANNDPISTINTGMFNPWVTVGVGNLYYFWTWPFGRAFSDNSLFPGGRGLWVPEGSRIQFGVAQLGDPFADPPEAPGNWPANTIASLAAIGVTTPVGIRPPGL